MLHRNSRFGDVEFEFPSSIRDLEVVECPRSLLGRLSELALQEDETRHVRYRCHAQKGIYSYLRCTWAGCRASLNYKHIHGEWRMLKSNSHHRHRLPNCRNSRLRAAEIYLSTLPSMLPALALRRIVCPRFNISDKQLYYLLAKERGTSTTPAKMIRELEE